MSCLNWLRLAVPALSVPALFVPAVAAATCSHPMLAPQSAYAAVNAPDTFVAGDLDGDGDIDFSVGGGDRVTSIMTVLRNNGDGTFVLSPDTVSGPPFEERAAIGDLDGDDDLDIAVIHAVPREEWSLMLIHLNNGDATFAPATTYVIGDLADDIKLGDLDGDGDLDIAIPNHAGYDDPTSIYLNDGSGAFTFSHDHCIVHGTPPWIALADMDDDGDLDLVGLHPVGLITVSLNHGDATFAEEEHYWYDLTLDLRGRGLEAGDLDGDGDIDLAIIFARDYPEPGGYGVLRNNGDATLGDMVGYDSLPSPDCTRSAFRIRLGDLDADCDLDVALSYFDCQEIAVVLNTGDSTLTDEFIYPARSGAEILAIADLDGDRQLDVANTNRGTDDVSVHLNTCEKGSCCTRVACVEGLTKCECETALGFFLGTGAMCSIGSTPCHGACCLLSGLCVDFISQLECEQRYRGRFQGPGVECASDLCSNFDLGACCLLGSCLDGLTADQCSSLGGTWAGPGTFCSPGLCQF